MKLVAKATAYDTYYQERYVWTCVNVKGPAPCSPCGSAINDAARLVPLADKVYKIGPLPDAEVAELKELIRRLEECP